MKLKRDSKGFTIIELLIATSVFGVMLLVLMTGIVFVSRIYYKGIVAGKTQEATRTILNEVTNAFQYSNVGGVATGAPVMYSGYSVNAKCVGNLRLSYITGARVTGTADSGAGTSKHALWLDVMKEGSACVPLDIASVDSPSDANSDTSAEAVAQRRELVPHNMRLDYLNIDQPSGRSFLNVSTRIIYGEKDLSPSGTCVSNRIGGQFCAASALSTTVKKRL